MKKPDLSRKIDFFFKKINLCVKRVIRYNFFLIINRFAGRICIFKIYSNTYWELYSISKKQAFLCIMSK